MKVANRILGSALAFVALVGGGVAFAGAKGKIPKNYADYPKLTLGLAIKNFIADFSAQELSTGEKGIRRFQVNDNSLPDLASALLCEFSECKLVYVEAAYTAEYATAHPWSSFIAPTVKQLGTPTSWVDLTGVGVTYASTLTDSAAWTDGQVVLAIGRANSGVPYVVVLADAKRLSVVASALKERVEGEIAAAAAADKKRRDEQAAAQQKRDDDERRDATQRAEQQRADQAVTEWEDASRNYHAQLTDGTAADVKRAATRAVKAAAGMQKIEYMSDEQVAEVQEWAKKVKDLANDKNATIFAKGEWQDT